ncbi:MAG: hypothetical protein K0V04_05185, partial [Deltaproteobacteria bacterium]|nr:hypothetical protein [Deltaproteobacteria bacterium]
MRHSIAALTFVLSGLLLVVAASCRPSPSPLSPRVHATSVAPTRVAPAIASPLSLTSSDGRGLQLRTFEAHGVIEDPLAITELTLSFGNPHGRTTEGQFDLVLPPGARVSRFAIERNQRWHEAEVVERLHARQTYEAMVHEDRDPALLEREAGNRFSARVYPIGSEGVRIKVSYVQALVDPTRPYRIATRGLPWLESLDIDVRVAEPGRAGYRTERQRLEAQTPARDFVVAHARPTQSGVRRGQRVVARVDPLAGIDPGEHGRFDRLTVLVDTSASRALEYDATVDALGRVLSGLSRRVSTARVEILAFDQQVVPIFDGPVAALGPEVVAALHARRPLGASDLGAALDALSNGTRDRVLLVTDGVISAGTQSEAELRRRLSALAGAGVRRLDVLAIGGVRDEHRLRQLVTGPLPDTGVLLSLDDPIQRTVDRLVLPTIDKLHIDIPGASWWGPRRVHGLQPGDHVLIHAQLPADRAMVVQVSGGRVTTEHAIELHTVDSALVDHAWMYGNVQSLVERIATLQDALESDKLRQLAVGLSVRHRIFNDLTAMLILDTEEDYARFGLDRDGLSDVLVPGNRGVVVVDRTTPEDDPIDEFDDDAPPPLEEEPEEELTGVKAEYRRGSGPLLAGRDRRRSRRAAWKDANTQGAAPPPRAASAPAPPPPPPSAPPAIQAVVPTRDATTVAAPSKTVSVERISRSVVTTSRDSAGISLAGSTGSESKDSVQGANVSNPAFGVIGLAGSYGPTVSNRRPHVQVQRTRVRGKGLSRHGARKTARAYRDDLDRCYHQTVVHDEYIRGRVQVQLRLGSDGRVRHVGKLRRYGLRDADLLDCVDGALRTMEFPVRAPHAPAVHLTLVFVPGSNHDGLLLDEPFEPAVPDQGPAAATGRLREIDEAIAAGRLRAASRAARMWRASSPTNVLALVALGRVARAQGRTELAARAYGSILDLFPSQAPMLRFAAAQLEELDHPAWLLAIDAYRRARSQRPDQPSGHRHLGFALLRIGQPREAFEVIAEGLAIDYPPDRFPGAAEVLRGDLGIIAAAWRRATPTDAPSIRRRLEALGATLAEEPSIRFVLSWESDANDVDLQ